MTNAEINPGSYPLLESVLRQKGLAPQGIYKCRDAARVFDASERTIQQWVRDGKLRCRDLPARANSFRRIWKSSSKKPEANLSETEASRTDEWCRMSLRLSQRYPVLRDHVATCRHFRLLYTVSLYTTSGIPQCIMI